MAKNKNKRKNLTAKVQQRGKARDAQVNPFEVKINKQKHSILGRKNKHGKGMPLVSRSKGIEKRNATLLQEYKQRHKTNKFLDRRLGENDPEMSVEDKMMERFALEKQRSHEKSSIYSLSAEDELTHYGQSLSSLEKFEEPQLDSNDEDGKIDKKFVADEHFGGFLTKKKANEDGKPKTRQEIFEEIISKSKKEKYYRQNEKEDVVKLTEQLDEDFRDVSQLIAKVKRNRDEERRKPDDYDMSVKELLFDIRAMASDRMKTPEELAKDEKERLEKMEKDRQRRMKGITEEEEEESKKRDQYMSADDLNDGFMLPQDNRSVLSYNDGIPSYDIHQGDTSKKDEEEDDGDDEEEDKEVGEGGDEEEVESDEEGEEDNASDLDSDNCDSNDDEEEVEDSKRTSNIRKSSLKKDKQIPTKKVTIQEPTEMKHKREHMMKSAQEELPYVFKAPETVEDFEGLMDGHSLTNQLTIVERVRKCHHPSLADGNKAKLETLTMILYRHLGKHVTQEGADADYVNGITKHLYELTQTCALASGNSLQAIITEKYDQFNQEAEHMGRAAFPSIDVLLYFKLVALLFPTSDFRHSVVTPTMLFMGAILSQCQVRSLRDVTSGLFICNLFLKYVHLSHRFVPEAINFLRGTLYMASSQESKTGGLVVAPFKHTGRFAKLLMCDGTSDTALKPVNILSLANPEETLLDQAQVSVWAVGLALRLLGQFSGLYRDVPSYAEVFGPIERLLGDRGALLDRFPQQVKTLGEQLLTDIEGSRQHPRKVLEVEKKKPVPLRMFEPKIEENYDPTRKHRSSGNKEYDERQRLVHRHRREMKGAIREIRKDSHFIARQKIKEQREKDDERKEKVKRLHQLLATQEGEFRDIKRKKQKI